MQQDRKQRALRFGHSRARAFAFSRSAFAAAVAAFTIALTGPALAATLIVQNHADSYITVSVDGAYGCNTAPGTTCSIPIAAGFHNLVARTADGRSIAQSANVPPAGGTWCVTSHGAC